MKNFSKLFSVSMLFSFCLSAQNFTYQSPDNQVSGQLEQSDQEVKQDLLKGGKEFFSGYNRDSRIARPSTAINLPTGFGGEFLDYFIGINVVNKSAFSPTLFNGGGKGDPDGVYAAGVSLGDPIDYLGLDVGAWLTDVSAPSEDGSFFAKLHRRIPSQKASIALGLNGIEQWGINGAVPSWYLSGSKYFGLRASDKWFYFVAFHLGLGSGFFAGDEHFRELIAEQRAKDNPDYGVSKVGPFAGFSVGLRPWMNFNLSYYSNDIDASLSFAPFKRYKLFVDLYTSYILEKSAPHAVYGISLSWSGNLKNHYNYFSN